MDMLILEKLSDDFSGAAYFVTAHNALQRVELDEDLWTADPSRAKLRPTQLTTGSRAILYCAHLIHDPTNERVIVASGSVFGEIVVWSCSVSFDTTIAASVHNVFFGHEGSIFGVNISPLIESDKKDDGIWRFLASCSDDRTIRLWRISEHPLQESLDPSFIIDIPQQDSTGFGNDLAVEASNGRDQCTAKQWAHSSRIWKVQFLNTSALPSSEALALVSCGEDASLQVWRLRSKATDDANAAKYRLEHCHTATLHNGKNVWSLHVTSGRHQVITGGADGNIIEHNLARFLQPNADEGVMDCVIETLPDIFQDQCSLTKTLEESMAADSLRDYAFLNPQEFLFTTKAGKLFRASYQRSDAHELDPTKSELSFQLIDCLQDCQGFSTMTSLPGKDAVCLCSSTKTCYIVEKDTIYSVTELKNTPSFLAAQAHQLQLGVSLLQSFTIIAPSAGSGTLELVELSKKHAEDRFEASAHDFINLPKGFRVTCAVFWTGYSIVFLGSRDGHIAIFDFSAWSGGVLIPAVHSMEAVTSLCWLPSDKNLPSEGHLLSVGRNGHLVVHFLQKHEGVVERTKIHDILLPIRELEGIAQDEESGHLLLWGFRSNQFILWDETTKYEVLSIECGGAHRKWAFARKGKGGGSLVFTRAKDLNFVSRDTPLHRPIALASHGREITSVAVSPPRSDDSDDVRLIATGAEDTVIQISQYVRPSKGSGGRFETLQMLRKHNTGIQHLAWSGSGRYLFSSGGLEEFFVWRVQRAAPLSVAVVCDSVCPQPSATPNLRITSFCILKERVHPPKQGSVGTQIIFTIAMTYSDSSVSIFQYNDLSSAWTRLGAGYYRSCCLTAALTFAIKERPDVVTAATDGHIAVCRVPSKFDLSVTLEFNPKNIHRIHQSSIKALDVARLSSGFHIILTGGDDNAVGITLWIEDSKRRDTALIRNAHAAAVTAVLHLPATQSGRNGNYWVQFVTASNDQCIRLWDLNWNAKKPELEGVQVREVASIYTAVADITSLAWVREDALLVCGVGMEVVQIL